MVTVHREDGFRVVIYLDDHEPPHVHVYAGGAEAKIGLPSNKNGVPEVIRSNGMRIRELRKVLNLISEQQIMLLEKWKEYHGGR